MKNKNLKVVSYSLFGFNPLYIIGAIENARLVRKYYPGWQARFYVSKEIEKSVINDLKNEGAYVIVKNNKKDSMEGVIWRFLAISDLDVDLMIVRDCDSRISKRELAAVNQWLDSQKSFHIMRDHPFHKHLILAGMWGCRKPLDFNIKNLVDEYVLRNFPTKNFKYGWDEEFLAKEIYPIIKNDVFVHDEFYSENKFPTKRIGIDFVGSQKSVKNKFLYMRNHFFLTKKLLKINYNKKSKETLFWFFLFLSTGAIWFFIKYKKKFKIKILNAMNQT